MNTTKEKERADFARKACEHFRDNPHCFTYAAGDPVSGGLFAIRWNPYTAMVLEIGDEEPLLYSSNNFIGGDFPKLAPTW